MAIGGCAENLGSDRPLATGYPPDFIMNRRLKIRLLIGLLVILTVIGYLGIRPIAVRGKRPPSEGFDLLQVENPKLRSDLLERVKEFNYAGSHHNIFSTTLPPPVAVVQKPVNVTPALPAPPLGPPPLVVPAHFFGYVTDDGTGARKAFFSDGEEIYVVGIGEVLLGRFRLVQIGNSSVELEETAAGNRATLAMEDQPAPLGQDQAGIPQIQAAAGPNPFRSLQSPTGAGANPFGSPQIPPAAGANPFRPLQSPKAAGSNALDSGPSANPM